MRSLHPSAVRLFSPHRRLVALCVSLAATTSILACQHDVVGPPPPRPSPAAPPPGSAARWTSTSGQYNSPSASSGSVGAVLAHDGSASPVPIGGTFTYRTIVQATFSGTVSRAWTIAGQGSVPDYGPAGPSGNGDGGMVLAGGSIGNGAVTADGNVGAVTKYIPLQGQYTIARGGLGQPFP